MPGRDFQYFSILQVSKLKKHLNEFLRFVSFFVFLLLFSVICTLLKPYVACSATPLKHSMSDGCHISKLACVSFNKVAT